MLAFFRVWCLVEIGAALHHSRAVLMKAGRHSVGEGGAVRFVALYPSEKESMLMVRLHRGRSSGLTLTSTRENNGVTWAGTDTHL